MAKEPNHVSSSTPMGRQAATPLVRPVSTSLPDPCKAKIEVDGSLIITMRIDPVIAKRLEGRAYKQPLGEYLWQNVLRRAIESHVF